MDSTSRGLFWVGVSVCWLFPSGSVSAVTMGSAPHDPPGNAQGSSTAGNAPAALNGAAEATAQSAPQAASMQPETSAKAASPVASPASTVIAAPPAARVGNGNNAASNPSLPFRSELGTELSAVDGATLELDLTEDGFERTLVLPNGNSQEVDFTFANGPVGTVSDDENAIGVFRAKSNELGIDFADGTTETITEGTNGGLVDRAQSADGHAMCTAWYPEGHVFSQAEKEAAVQEYASRLGLPASAPATKQHAHDAGPPCGGAFIAGGSQQKSAGAETKGDVQKGMGAQTAIVQPDIPAPERRMAALENGAIFVRTSTVHLIDAPIEQARLENTSFAPEQSAPESSALRADSAPPPEPGASNCLTVASDGTYWGFQNNCAKAVQFAYCQMSDGNPLTSCTRTSVVGSVAARGFSALVSDRSLTEKSVDHEFRWMACNGGAGEVVPHLDKIDPPSGRCEREVAPPQ